mmetsp:Transcript_5911/g.8804  ORF Transcript_5911/g.8804 Transcript_5911/m.8804 type:complete len:154 (-) Transcript_5911:377-838(-)
MANFDFDEFLFMYKPSSDPKQQTNIQEYFAEALKENNPKIARINLPRVNVQLCNASDPFELRLGDENELFKEADETINTFNFSERCYKKSGLISQKSAFQPSLTVAVSTHYSDFYQSAYQDAGEFVVGQRPYLVADEEVPFLFHLRSEVKKEI